MKKGVIFILAAAAMTLNSCGLYSKYEKQTSVDESLYGDVVTRAEAAHAGGYVDSLTLGNVSWRDLFVDPKLKALIELGLENNSDLKMARLNIESAEAQMRAARLAYLPSLNIAAQLTGSGLMDSSRPVKSYSAPLSASWEFDLFGGLTNTKRATGMLLVQQELLAQSAQTQIVAAIANLYYTISMLEQQIKIAYITEKSWEQSYEVAKSMKQAGMMNQAGLSQIEASLYSVKMASVTLGENLTISQNAMCSLLAVAPRQIEGGELCDVELPISLQLGVPVQMLSSRPDVMAAEAALAASFYSRNVARSAFYPKLSLTGSATWTNLLGSVIVDPAEFIYSVVGSAVQPIFNRGLTRAQLEVAKNNLEITRIAFEQQLLDAGIEVNNAYKSLITAQSNAELYAQQIEALNIAAESTSLMMKHGSTTYLEVLTAQQTLFSAQLAQVGNRYDQMQGVISLYKALGGGRF